MSDLFNITTSQMGQIYPAFVIKNYIPYSNKVLLLHREHGKIICMYSADHQATLLTTGSLILCQVEKTHTIYRFLNLEISSVLSINQLHLIHDIMRLCFKQIPNNIAVLELFDFLLYVYHDLNQLSEKGRMVVMLRLFLMLDLLPEQHEIYKAAILDPYGEINQNISLLHSYVAHSWDNFYRSGTS